MIYVYNFIDHTSIKNIRELSDKFFTRLVYHNVIFYDLNLVY